MVVPHKYHDGFASADIGYITEELFDLLARRLAKHFGYTRGAVSVKEDRSVFQFWNTHG